MADKDITLRQKNTSGVYDKLYTKTTATQSKLSTATAALFGDDTSDADAALAKIADTVKSIGNVQVKVVDPNGNPIQGARITGLYGTPTTASDGTAHGVFQTNPISISSPYIDLKDQTVDASGYVGSFNVLTVTLPIVGENSIIRVTSSKTVKFSKAVKTIDVCCVGGGSAGGWYGMDDDSYNFRGGAGGGGGGIVNSYGLGVEPNTPYNITIGAGGTIQQYGYGNAGGSTIFLNVTAPGALAPTSSSAGKAGVTGCGDGGGAGGGQNTGGANTTVSEFNDGVTFYSGGGGGGMWSEDTNRTNGGSPNGASGATAYVSTVNTSRRRNATTAGIGGGGGGGAWAGRYNSDLTTSASQSAGGPGLVAIRFHF